MEVSSAMDVIVRVYNIPTIELSKATGIKSRSLSGFLNGSQGISAEQLGQILRVLKWEQCITLVRLIRDDPDALTPEMILANVASGKKRARKVADSSPKYEVG